MSPVWVVRSLKEGKQQRCLMVSADASRALPAAAAVATEESSVTCSSPLLPGAAAAGAKPLSNELLASRLARERVLSEVLAAAASRGSGGEGSFSAAQQQSTPAVLLRGLEWSVMDPPSAAQLDGQPAQQQWRRQRHPDLDIVPDSEEDEGSDDEEGLGPPQPSEAPFCLTATQAAVGEVLGQCSDGDGGSPSNEDDGGAPTPWVEEVVFRGPAITLLLPCDGRGELGHTTLTWQLEGRQLAAGELLARLAEHYQSPMPAEEVLALLCMHPSAVTTVQLLRPAFLELQPLPRGALLGARCSWEGIAKATREPAGSVYELRLGC